MDTSASINEVALYLRKSRGESEQDLEKHKHELVTLADSQGWTYVLYEELASGETIEYRPKMQELLDDLREDMYDAVLVMDYDRLGRGDESDQATIKKTFRETNTLIVTPQKVYNLRDETDDMLSDFLGVMARFEYKQIKKRLQRGKKIGAKLGYWTNGVPPFPYVYNAERKGLVVKEEQRTLYEWIKGQVLSGKAMQRIAFELNRQGYKTNRGKHWTENAIYRIVQNEVHLGRVVYGKTKGSGHKNKKTEPLQFNPRRDWTIVENAHEPVMTEEEFNTIAATLSRNKLIKDKARKGTFILSGLIKCGKCGYSMAMQKKKYGGKEHVIIKSCWKADPYGNRCDNSGIKEEIVLREVYNEILQYEAALVAERDYTNASGEHERLSLLLPQKEKNLAKLRASLERIRELYELNDYTREEYFARRDKRTEEIKQAEKDIEDIRKQLNYYETLSADEKLNRIRELIELWDSGDTEGINRALRTVVSQVGLIRDGDNVNINVKFLA